MCMVTMQVACSRDSGHAAKALLASAQISCFKLAFAYGTRHFQRRPVKSHLRRGHPNPHVRDFSCAGLVGRLVPADCLASNELQMFSQDAAECKIKIHCYGVRDCKCCYASAVCWSWSFLFLLRYLSLAQTLCDYRFVRVVQRHRPRSINAVEYRNVQRAWLVSSLFISGTLACGCSRQESCECRDRVLPQATEADRLKGKERQGGS
jgi:hypothetical protein